MVQIAFWNLKGSGRTDLLEDLVRAEAVDLLFLAEFGGPSGPVVRAVNARRTGTYYWEPHEWSGRVRALTHFAPPVFLLHDTAEHFAIWELVVPAMMPLLLCVAHWPSRLHHTDDDQTLVARTMKARIEAIEVARGHQNTMIIGDLNAMPFDRSKASADGLQGVMDRRIAGARSRRVFGRPESFFFNPTWALMGDDEEGAPGTHFYGRGRVLSYFWHAYDQVLLRPSLVPYYSRRNLRIATRIGSRPLLSKSGRPLPISDHLPLLLNLPIEGAHA